MLSSSLRRAYSCQSNRGAYTRRRRFHSKLIVGPSTKGTSILEHRHSIKLFNHGSNISKLHIRTLVATTDEKNISFHNEGNVLAIPHPHATTFSTISSEKPHLLLSPKDLLIEVYQKNGVNTEESFHVSSYSHKSKTWYTATFTDPLTNEVFPCGLERRNFLGRQRRDARTKAMNGKVYCLDSVLAEHAAAARAIDCFIYREGTATCAATRLCLESPYTLQADNDITSFQNKLQLSQVAVFLPQLLVTPCRLLHTKFALINEDSTKNIKTHRREHHDGSTWFTATFTDPITNEIFTSGLVFREVNVQETGSALSLHLAKAMYVDGFVYYKEASLAQQAAAARAIDCFVYREKSIDNTDTVQICLEKPYLMSAKNESRPLDHDLISSRPNVTIVSDRYTLEMKSNYVKTRLNENNSVSFPYPDIQLDETLQNDHVLPNDTSMEEPTEIRKLHNLSTMGRILEIWTETNDLDTKSDDSCTLSEFNSNSIDPPGAKIRMIVDWYERVNSNPRTKAELSALTFSKLLTSLGQANMQLKGRGDECGLINVEAYAKKFLNRIVSLSNPNYLEADIFNAFLFCLDRCDPERSAIYAEELLMCMRDQSKHDRLKGIPLPRPNVETYNIVMELWAAVEGSNSIDCVNRVFSLLEAAALCGDEFSPRPNIHTFQTILAMNSRKDGRFSFEQAKSWLSKAQEISESICGETLTPNADIFYAALKPEPKSFDVKVAESASLLLRHGGNYIGGFKEIDDNTNLEAADTAQWLNYATELGLSLTMDMYESVIRSWTKTGTEKGLLTAEHWAQKAISSGLPFRSDTFHPIIAAWAFCQSEHAPAHIKEWINRLDNLSATNPQLKPDLDIMSAKIIVWMNIQSGFLAKTKDLDELILSSPSESSSSLSSFGERLNGALMDSPHQTIIDGKTISQDVIFKAAQNCTEELNIVLNADQPREYNIRDITALNSMIGNTIIAWSRASQFATLHPTIATSSTLTSAEATIFDATYCVHEMFKVAKLVKDSFDIRIKHSGNHSNNNDNNSDETISIDDDQSQLKFQLLGQCFVEIISQLSQIDSVLRSNENTDTYFSREMANIESILNEFNVMYSEQQILSQSHSDNYYSTSETAVTKTMVTTNTSPEALRHHLYKEILTGCKQITCPSDYGHVMRLCTLIMNHLSSSSSLSSPSSSSLIRQETGSHGLYHDEERSEKYDNNLTEIFVDIVLLMKTIVPIAQERAYVITILWQNSKPFFRRKLVDRRNTNENGNSIFVNQAQLIGAMRKAMGDWDKTEVFVRQFDEWRTTLPSKRRARGNTWLAFVQDLIKRSSSSSSS